MAGMMDVLGGLLSAQIQSAIGEHADTLAKLPQFLSHWTGFMARQGETLERIENRLVAMDRTLVAIIDGFPPSVDASVLALSQQWARDDARQTGVTNGRQ
jgi:hypothetical protein